MNEQLYKKFREYIENNPTSLAFARLSEILFNAGRTDAAITLLEKGLEQNPAYLTAYNLLGDFYYQKGELERAKQAYKRTIDLDPFNLNALANLLKIAVEQGNFAEAGARIFQILSIDPTNRAAYNYLTQYWDKIEEEFPDLTKEPEEEVPTIEIEDIGGTQFSLIGTNPIAEVKPLPVVVRTAPEEIKALDQLSEIPSMKPIELDEIEQGPL
ncbi:tetratricopeptide repeat protein, partial [bacterium]|nr:tetratricopeptide repeat protein [bacterium]